MCAIIPETSHTSAIEIQNGVHSVPIYDQKGFNTAKDLVQH